jgi:hypothetical protein
MQLDQVSAIGTGQSVQSIDVLGDHGNDSAHIFQFYDCMVYRVWPRGAKCRPGFELVVPVLDSGRFRGHEVLVIHRPATSPNAVWSPEIGDSASGRNTSAGKNHYPVCFPEVSSQVFQLSSHLRKFQTTNRACPRIKFFRESRRRIIERGTEDFQVFLHDVGRLAPIIRAQIIWKDRKVVFRIGDPKAERNAPDDLERLI